MPEAHTVPGLACASLISIKQMCDNGCSVIYDKNECRVYYKKKIVLVGEREPATGLWVLPITPKHKPTRRTTPSDLKMMETHPNSDTIHTACNAYSISNIKDLVTYLHQCLLSPTKTTLLHAIKIINSYNGPA